MNLTNIVTALRARIEAGVASRAARDDDEELSVRAELDRAILAAEDELLSACREFEAEEESRATRAVEVERELGGRVELRNYLGAVAADRPLSGAEAEINSELGLSGNQVPWAALVPRGEARQDVATTAPAAGIARDQMPILARVFAMTDAAWLGVQMPSVARGNPVYPVLSGGVGSANNRAVGAAVEAVAASFETTTISPTRITARYLFGVEDVAQFAGLEDALRMDLRQALGSGLDDQILTGNGTAPNFSGLLRELGTATDATAGLATHDDVAALGAAGVDGIYASMESNTRFLVGTDTYRFGAGLIQAGDGRSALQHLTERGVGLRATSRLPGIVSKKQSFVRVAGESMIGREAYGPIWEGLELIRDPYTGAAKGQVAVTAIMLCGFAVVRKAAFHHGALQIRA